jgi:hypothetical protein
VFDLNVGLLTVSYSCSDKGLPKVPKSIRAILKQLVMGIGMALVWATHAAAEESPAVRSTDPGSIITFALENDLFAGHDDGYTNGVRTSYVSPEADIPPWIEKMAAFMPFFPSVGHTRWTMALGQSMFAPDDLTLKTPQPDDRPYAGWLYGTVGVIADRDTTLDNLQLTIGMVGPLRWRVRPSGWFTAPFTRPFRRAGAISWKMNPVLC